MSGTGLSFTGCIGVGLVMPDVVYVSKNDGTVSGGGLTVTLGPPADIKVGYPMVACVEAGAFGGGAGPYTFTPDADWTPVYEDPTSGFDHQIIANLYTKTADAADEAGTSSYSWTVSTPSTQAGMSIAIVGWRPVYGTTVSNPAVTHSLTPSIASPGGTWQFAFITQRTASGFVQPTPDPYVTSPASLFAEVLGGYRSGRLRAYGSNNVSPITGSYSTGDAFPRQALLVAAISS